MYHTLFGCVNRQVSDVKAGVAVEQASQAKTAVYRDELTKRQAPRKSVVKKSVRFADSEPTILGDGRDELEKVKGKGSDEKRIVSNSTEKREGIRVKVKMTKEEAARLLSKCREGGLLEFRDVARELASIPLDRVSVLTTSTKVQEEATLLHDMAK